MGKVIIRHRLVTWFDEFEDRLAPGGINRREHLAHKGEEVDIPDDEVERIKSVNTDYDPPFYTDDEADQIRKGTYNGRDRELLLAARSGVRPASQVEPVEGEHGDASGMDAAELANYIVENKLNVDQTVSLAGDDEDSINKVLDAENIATDNDPRKGVVDRLEAKLNAATQS